MELYLYGSLIRLDMKEKLVEFETAKLAKEKGFNWTTSCGYEENGEIYRPQYWEPGCETDMIVLTEEALDIDCDAICLAPTQSLLQKFIREKRGVHIEIHRNASGWYWSMCKSDGGTDLGWSDHRGTDLGGVWDKFEEALEDAIFVQLSYDIPNNTKVIKHWGNYVDFAIKSINK